MKNSDTPQPTKEELRALYKAETEPSKKKAIASQALDGEVCYWEYCCKPWAKGHKDTFPYCSEEHKALFDAKFPVPTPTKKRTPDELREGILKMRDEVFHKNVLREEPRQESLLTEEGSKDLA